MGTSNVRPLEELIEQFIEQAIKFRRIRPKLITHYQMQLIGLTIPFLHLGYVRYLKSIGVSKPKVDDLCSFLVGRYWEAERSMRALRDFWRWAQEMKHVKGRMPPDLRFALVGVEHPFRVKITLTQSENQ